MEAPARGGKGWWTVGKSECVERANQARRTRAMRSKLGKIRDDLLKMAKGLDEEETRSSDKDNLSACLEAAAMELREGIESYTDFI